MLPPSIHYPDRDRDSFAALLMRYLQSRGETRPLRYDAERFALHLGDDQVALERRYQQFLAADQESHDGMMDALYQGMRPLAPQPLNEVLAKLRPVLLSQMCLANLGLLAAAQNKNIGQRATRPWQSDLAWGLMVEESSTFMPVTVEQIKQWNSQMEALFPHAQSLMGAQPLEWRNLGGGLFQAQCKDGLSASRLLTASDWLAQLALGKALALAPARDCLIVFDAANSDALRRGIELAQDWALKDANGLPPILMEYAGAGWVAFDLPPGTPAFGAFRALQLSYLAKIYKEQADLLAEQHGLPCIDAYCPELAVAKKANGQVVSYSIYSDSLSEPQWLPHADEVVFFSQADGVTPVQWQVVEREGLLTRVEMELNPPRYLINQFPEAAWLEQHGL